MTLDTLTWPARRWLADRLVGQHAYSRNVAVSMSPLNASTSYSFTYGPSIRLRPVGREREADWAPLRTTIRNPPPRLFDQERA